MTGVCGWIGTAPASAESTLRDMATRLNATAGRPNASLIQSDHAIAGDEIAESDNHRFIVAIAGRPYWRSAELQQLADQRNNAYALLEAFQRYDTGLLSYLRGNFVFVLFDHDNHRLIAAIDRIGRQSLYYYPLDNGLGFASTAASLRSHPCVSTSITAQGIFDYLYFHMVPSPHSIYAGIEKLSAGHYLDYRAGQLNIGEYWQPEFENDKDDIIDQHHLAEQLYEAVLQSVKKNSDVDNVGAFLSGGLDSATIAGMLAQTKPGNINTYSIGFDAAGYDEMVYARIVSNHFETHRNEYYVTPQDVVDIIPTIASNYDEPFGNSSAVSIYYCAKLAAENGTTQLLAGDGGDELFAGNYHYAKQKLFEFYRHVPGFLRRFAIEPIVVGLPAQIPLARKAKSYLRQANTDLPDRLQDYNFLHRIDHRQIFNDDFLTVVDAESPLRLLRDRYQHPEQGSTLNRMLYLDWQFTLADNDLRKVNRMCALHDVDVVYPLLSDELIELSCRIPSKLKLNGQNARFIYKQAMKNFLPDTVIKKPKHGFGLPAGLWLHSYKPLQELGYDSVLALKHRGYFQADFLERAIALHREDHAAYYGVLIWILMMLELWLQAHHQ